MSALCPSDSATANEMASKPIYYTLPEFLVNLKASSKSNYIKTTIVFEAYARDVSAIESNLPKIIDTVNAHLSDLRASDLAGKTAIAQLRNDILAKVNKIITPAKITDVLFKEITVQ